MKEHGVSSETLAKIAGGDYSTKDDKVFCYSKCIFDKEGAFDKDSKFQENIFKELIAKKNRAISDKAVDKCKTETGKDNCETAYNIYKCYAMEMGKAY